MAFRLLRICSSEERFEARLKELKTEFLIPRNYNSKNVEAQFTRVRNLPGENYVEKRKNSLEKKKNNVQTERTIAPMDYNPLLPNISEVFSKYLSQCISRSQN